MKTEAVRVKAHCFFYVPVRKHSTRVTWVCDIIVRRKELIHVTAHQSASLTSKKRCIR